MRREERSVGDTYSKEGIESGDLVWFGREGNGLETAASVCGHWALIRPLSLSPLFQSA